MGLLRSIFKHFDKDGNGRISTDELKRGLKMHGVEVQDDDLTAISKEMDLNKDGFVSLSEFAHAICGGFEDLSPEEARARRPPMSPQKLRQDFDAIPTSVIRKVFADLVRSGCPKKVPCARLAEALRRHALLDVTENDLKELSSADALTIEEVFGSVSDVKAAGLNPPPARTVLTPRSAEACLKNGVNPEILRIRDLG